MQSVRQGFQVVCVNALPTFSGLPVQHKLSRTLPACRSDEKQINRNQHVAVNTQREECISMCADMHRKWPGISVEDWLWATAGRARGQWGHQHPNQCPAAKAVVLQRLSHWFVFTQCYTVLVVNYTGSCLAFQTHSHTLVINHLCTVYVLNGLLMTCLCVQLVVI